MADEQFIYMSLDDFVKWKENTLVHNGEQIPYNPNVVPFVPDKTPEQLAALQTEIETLRTKVATLEESGKKYYIHYINFTIRETYDAIAMDVLSSKSTRFMTFEELLTGFISNITYFEHGTTICVTTATYTPTSILLAYIKDNVTNNITITSESVVNYSDSIIEL